MELHRTPDMADETSVPQATRRQERRRELLDKARELFVTHGYEHTSLDMIIAETGGSRRNIYELFGNKKTLFKAVMQDQIDTILTKIQVPDPATDPRPIQQQLEALGTAFLTGLMAPDALQTMRQFVVYASEWPELSREAYAAGPAILHARLETYLTALAAKGDLVLADIPTAARILAEMLKGGLDLEALMTHQYTVPHHKIEKQVRAAVDMFLNGTLPR
ncbi:TetR/AcrR family transcriptional regulator C-terminal domain-containing protein [Sediminimonas qiaohouensis]|uniref:TetR/AcrR family transcriptional regulator C-terminal domain-containing protein n=1 Tax=Sediminimonas qiaohouensis TaxID=552061 RepID=UPI000A056548